MIGYYMSILTFPFFIQYLRMATHHTMVSLLFSTLPRVILCTAWPDLTLHSLMLSTPPVRITSKLVFQAIDKILPVEKIN